MAVTLKELFDKSTWTLTFVVYDSKTQDAIVIDPVWDYDPAASVMSYESVTKVKSFVDEMKLKVKLNLETHAHGDHVSGSQELNCGA